MGMFAASAKVLNRRPSSKTKAARHRLHRTRFFYRSLCINLLFPSAFLPIIKTLESPPYSEFRKSSAESGIAFAGGGLGTALVMLTACNSSRTTLRMLFSSLSVCSVARMACTRNSLRLADGTCCSNAHARRCCGSLRFGRKTYCGRFMPRFYGATRRPTHARIRPRSPCRPAGKSSCKARLWGRGGGSPRMRRRPIARRGWRAGRSRLP